MKLVELIKYDIDAERLKKATPDILANPINCRFNGTSIQHRSGMLSPWDQVDGLDSLRLYGNCIDKDFNVINTKFKNTEYERIINHFKLVRSRLFYMHHKTCYYIHKDMSWRLHIPIKTHPDCLFYFPDHKKHFHLEEGKVYKVNTTERHTFINANSEDRIHFVGCLYD